MSWASLRVPASSANLGPGFDALGLALDLYLHCRFRGAERFSIRVAGGESAGIPADETNLIWQTALRVAASEAVNLPSVELEIRNEIPLGKGLGSSAAALTAGVILADHILKLDWSRDRILEEAAHLEGHPDNVAACVLGGMTVSGINDHGHACAIRFPLPPQCAIALLIPDFTLPTSQSRAVLPAHYSREDAIFNLQRAGLLVAAFATGRTELLSTALCDRLHQPFRGSLVPGLAAVLAHKASGLFGCVLSGAGPSILVFFEPGHPEVVAKLADLFAAAGQGVRVLYTSVAQNGFEIITATPG